MRKEDLPTMYDKKLGYVVQVINGKLRVRQGYIYNFEHKDVTGRSLGYFSKRFRSINWDTDKYETHISDKPLYLYYGRVWCYKDDVDKALQMLKNHWIGKQKEMIEDLMTDKTLNLCSSVLNQLEGVQYD